MPLIFMSEMGVYIDSDLVSGPLLTPEQQSLLDEYWSAKTPAEEHWAYVRMLRLGFAPCYGEDDEQVERIKRCPDCPPWENAPLSERGFGV